MKRVLLGLGSNRTFENKTPLEILSYARDELSRHLADLSFSSVYRTKAMYVEDQEDFYNMAALGYVPDETNPFEFLQRINSIEAKYGRDRSKEIRFGPRSLDIDIELFGDEEINHPDLQIPHPRMEERAFVLIPAIEILTNPADVLTREKYISCLEKVTAEGGADGIVKLGGYRNGNGTDSCSDKTCL
jgi:2-amino-4-hydroxy-6-hydroxymethyldihydropteridine diphosphokinase